MPTTSRPPEVRGLIRVLLAVLLVQNEGSWGEDRQGRFDDGAPVPALVTGTHQGLV